MFSRDAYNDCLCCLLCTIPTGIRSIPKEEKVTTTTTTTTTTFISPSKTFILLIHYSLSLSRSLSLALSLSLSLARALSQSLISIKVIAWVPLNATFSFIQEFYSVSVPLTSVTRLGDFWNILAKIFITKVTQMFGDFLDSCEKCHFRSNWLCYFLGNFWKNLGYFLFQHLVTLSVCCPPLRRFSHYSISSTLTGERNSTDTLCKWHRLESSFF